MLASQASTVSNRRKHKTDNKLADDEEELMVAFLEANEMLWDKKATHYRTPDLKNVLDGLGLLLHRAQENLEHIGKTRMPKAFSTTLLARESQ